MAKERRLRWRKKTIKKKKIVKERKKRKTNKYSKSTNAMQQDARNCIVTTSR